MRTIAPSFLACTLILAACGDDDPEGTATNNGSTDGSVDTSADASVTADSGSSDAESTGSDTTGADTTGSGTTARVTGDAFPFASTTQLEGATITILEFPDETTTTDAEGHFEFPALTAGAKATFVLQAEGYPTTYTKTFTLPEAGATLERVTFQVPDDATYDLLAGIVGIDPDPTTCQIATTVTRVGKSVYDPGAHGEDLATVTIEPALPAELGPIYFNEDVIPQLDLVETSPDGGVLFVNVPAGEYTLTAHKEGVEFEQVDVICEGDVLVNASPPNGLQAL